MKRAIMILGVLAIVGCMIPVEDNPMLGTWHWSFLAWTADFTFNADMTCLSGALAGTYSYTDSELTMDWSDGTTTHVTWIDNEDGSMTWTPIAPTVGMPIRVVKMS